MFIRKKTAPTLSAAELAERKAAAVANLRKMVRDKQRVETAEARARAALERRARDAAAAAEAAAPGQTPMSKHDVRAILPITFVFNLFILHLWSLLFEISRDGRAIVSPRSCAVHHCFVCD